MADTQVQLRDANNTAQNFRALLDSDGLYSFYHASRANIQLPDGSTVGMVGTTMSKFSDGFSGPTLAAGTDTLTSLADKWKVVRNTGVTVQQTNGSLVITTGTVSGNEFLMVGKQGTTIPANIIATLSMTARSANQEVRIGYVEVNTNGDPLANPNLTNFFTNHCAVLFNGTANNLVTLETVSGSHPATKTIAAGNQTVSTTVVEYCIEARPEDITYQQAVADSTTVKTSTGARISSTVPSPNVIYAPFIWVRNTGTATSNVITIQRIVSMDVQELQAEIGGGRGNIAASQAIPTYTVNTTSVSGTVSLGNAQVSTTTNNNAVPHRAVSAATTNATLVKTGIAKLTGGLLTNTSASPKFVKFYNKSTAPVPGTDTILFTVPIPANGNVALGTVFDQYGLSASAGLGYAITGAVADNDTTAVAVGDVIVQLLFI